jgi:general secretion pathway protein A
MYIKYYQLDKKPFQLSSDPAFIWLGKQHKEALATLKYGVLQNEGFLLLTGDVGTGKTTLINTLIQSLGDDVIYASVPDPSLSVMDFFNFIAASFGIDEEFSSKGKFISGFKKFLLASHQTEKKVLLIIDESQLLKQELLEEIRLLSNIETAGSKLINIFFVGQNELIETLRRDRNRALRQRLTLNYNIEPLTPGETDAYIRHRLRIAGSREPIFDSHAVQEIFMYSGGFPRRINVICDHALLTGYTNDLKTINAAIIHECAGELEIPAYVKAIDHKRITNDFDRPEISRQKEDTAVEDEKPPEKEKNYEKMLLMGVLTLFFVSGIIFGVISFKESQSLQPELALVDENVIYKNVFYEEQNKDSSKSESSSTNSLNITENRMASDGNRKPEQEKRETKPIFSDPDKGVKKGEGIETEKLGQYPGGQPSVSPSRGKDQPLPDAPVVIRFEYNENTPTNDTYDRLKELVTVLLRHPDAKIEIVGYTDNDGSQSYNLKLSEFRATAIKSYFIGRGLAPDRIEAKGLGSANPIEGNDSEWGRRMNRRVEIKIRQ